LPRRIAIVVAEAIVEKSQPAAKVHPTVREALMARVTDDMAAGVQCAGASEMRAGKRTATEPATQASADMANSTAAQMAHSAAEAQAASAHMAKSAAAEMASTKPTTAEMAAAATEPATMAAAAAEPTSTPVAAAAAAATTTATARQRRGCDRGTGESDRGNRREGDLPQL
jgi:cell wall-associated NlpC family hydrolase